MFNTFRLLLLLSLNVRVHSLISLRIPTTQGVTVPYYRNNVNNNKINIAHRAVHTLLLSTDPTSPADPTTPSDETVDSTSYTIKLNLPPLGIIFEEITPGLPQGVIVTGFVPNSQGKFIHNERT